MTTMKLGPGGWCLCGGGNGQVIASSLESVLVGHPVDGVGLAVVADERVASPHDRSNALNIQRVDLLLRAPLLDVDAVLSSIAA